MPPSFRFVETNGVHIRVALEGSGPLVVFVHGFPESWYSWRHQIGPVAAAGFTACAIDLRGYGGSDKPYAVEAYDMETVVSDIVGVIAALSADHGAILVGHDWGAPLAWSAALAYPQRVRAVAGLSVPYMGAPPAPFIDFITEEFTNKGRFFYQAYFQEIGPAEAELEADVRTSLRRFFYSLSGDAPEGAWPVDKAHGDTLLPGMTDPERFPDWLTPGDEDYYVAEFSRSGFRGPLNSYRNHRRNYQWESRMKDKVLSQPSLFICGTRDIVLKMFPFDPIALMTSLMPDLRGVHLLEGCGHWTQQERPHEVTARLLDWLARI